MSTLGNRQVMCWRCAVWCLLFACMLVSASVVGLSQNVQADSTANIIQAMSVSTIAQQPAGDINPAAVAGWESCKKCHDKEIAGWKDTAHHDSIKKIDGHADTPRFAEAIGVKVGDILKNSACTQCHATPQMANGKVAAVSGVSCESCHGGSQGNPEWLKLHAVKGLNKAQQMQCNNAGMIRASDVYDIAKNCLGCHSVPNQRLVNAGHPVTTKWKYELVGGTTGEVRHDFQWLKKNQGKNDKSRQRLKYVVGMLVDLEVTLDSLKAVPANQGRKPFAKGHARRLKSLSKDLKKLVAAFGGNVPKPVLNAHNAITAMGRISPYNFTSQAKAAKAAPIIAKAASDVAKQHNGKQWAVLDNLMTGKVKPRYGYKYKKLHAGQF